MFAHILSAILKAYPFSSNTSASDVKGPTFLDLPVEITQMIQALLPLSSAVALALTCRTLLEIIGGESLRSINLPANSLHRTEFLLSLQRELPRWQYCHPCSVFHPSEKHRSRCLGPLHATDCAWMCGNVFFFPNFRIFYHQAQWVMNRHRFGTLCAKDLKDLSYKGPDKWWDGDYIHKAIVTSIEDGGLAVHMTSTRRMMDKSNMEDMVRQLPRVCPHVDGIEGFSPQPLAASLSCQLSHDASNKRSCIECAAEWKTCLRCQTRFRADVQRTSVKAELIVKLETRKWLGPCQTPFDPMWWRHCEKPENMMEGKGNPRVVLTQRGTPYVRMPAQSHC